MAPFFLILFLRGFADRGCRVYGQGRFAVCCWFEALFGFVGFAIDDVATAFGRFKPVDVHGLVALCEYSRFALALFDCFGVAGAHFAVTCDGRFVIIMKSLGLFHIQAPLLAEGSA